MAALVSSMPVHLQNGQIEGARVRSFGRISSVRSTDSEFHLREIEEVPSTSDVNTDTSPEVEEMEEKVYVAVGKEVKDSKSTLVWALQNISRDNKVVLVHVHRPAQLIPLLGGRFPASQLTSHQVKAYRVLEKEMLNKTLEEYLLVCASGKAQAEKLVIEMDDVAKGLVELIAKHGIGKLVMGAAADKHFSKKMKAPKSKTASAVQKEALPSCNIWFVCKGNLICRREASLYGYKTTHSPVLSPSPSTGSTQTELLSSRSSSQGNQLSNSKQDLSRDRSVSDSWVLHEDRIVEASLRVGIVRMSTLSSRLTTQGTSPSVGILKKHPQDPNHSFSSASDELLSNLGLGSMQKNELSENGSVILPGPHESGEDILVSTLHDDLEEVSIDSDIYDQLQQALFEAQSLRREAYEESCRRRKAERDALDAIQKAKASERLYALEVKQRKVIVETVAELEMELELLKSQRDELFEELKKADEHKSTLEIQLRESDRVVKDFEKKLSTGHYQLSILQKEKDDLQQEVDSAVKEVEDLRKKKEGVTMCTHTEPSFSEFSYVEIEKATQSFNDSLKIGEGGYGNVYKGFLRHTTVAIKTMHPESIQGQTEFYQEVAVLSKIRHPNLVTLIGACSETWSLIYEFLPNGSLEDRLACKDNTAPLSWHLRTRIAADICSALIFLHSNKPHSVVHGDLKPSNILLDSNFGTKLGDFGISRLLVQSTTTTTLYRRTHPKGTFAYMDPQFLATGELTPRSDIYSFGIIILRLLTGRPALGIVKEVQYAFEKGKLHTLLDASAGDWPFVQAQQLAHLALRCSEINRKSRPDLVGDVWRILEPLKASSERLSISLGSLAEDSDCIPSYFICPISQEVMRDPHVAADGFTYEAEALKGWLESGHDTSPMTNLKLAHCNLIPNHALRSAIQEWLQQRNS